LKDLEIRGAGNLLGADQHGHISAVGFDLYTRLLAESVSQLKEAQALVRGEQSEERRPAGTFGGLTPAALEPSPSISLPLPAYLTAEYIEDEPTRLNFYQRLAAVVRGPDLAELVDELVDRFGPLPEAVQNLIYIVSLRLEARRAGLQAVQSLDGEVVLRFERLPRVDVAELSRAVGTNLRAGSNQIRLPRGRGSAWTAQLRTLIESLPNQSGQPVLASSGRRSVAGP
jgi:transcription-repair coupling factor (superfamily II helicase)